MRKSMPKSCRQGARIRSADASFSTKADLIVVELEYKLGARSPLAEEAAQSDARLVK
jgi:hypothetical protein